MFDLKKAISDVKMDTVGQLLEEISAVDTALLINDYYGSLSLSDLQGKYKLSSLINTTTVLLNNFPRYLSKEMCRYDGHELYGKFPSKSSLTKTDIRLKYVCAECKHEETYTNDRVDSDYLNKCQCKNCEAQKAAEKEAREMEIQNQNKVKLELLWQLSKPKNVDFSKLSISETILLATWIREYSDDSSTYIEPFAVERLPEFVVTYDDVPIQKWQDSGYVAISPKTNVDAIVLNDEDDSAFSYYPMRVAFEVAGGKQTIELFNAANWSEIFKGKYDSQEQYEKIIEELFEYWMQVSVDNLIEYMQREMSQRKLEAPTGDKTRQLLSNLLLKYTPGQIMSFIYSQAKNAADYYVTKDVSRRQAANSIVSLITKLVNTAEDRGWNIDSYKRTKGWVESATTHTLYAHVLRLKGDGFGDRVTREYIKELYPFYL